jgi:hypothetical protein
MKQLHNVEMKLSWLAVAASSRISMNLGPEAGNAEAAKYYETVKCASNVEWHHAAVQCWRRIWR